MKSMRRVILAVGACALAAISGNANAQEFDGKATKGENSCNGKFTYDTGNALSGSVISHACATALGLGTTTTAGGVTTFMPTAGQGATGPFQINNGAYTVYCYENITITCTDSRGVECSFTDKAYVATNNQNGNRVLAGESILNQDWINGVDATLRGAGAGARGQWGEAPPPKGDAQPGIDTDAGQTRSDVPPTNEPVKFLGEALPLPDSPTGFGFDLFWMYGSVFKANYVDFNIIESGTVIGGGFLPPDAIDPRDMALLPCHGVDPSFVFEWLSEPFELEYVVFNAELQTGAPPCPVIAILVPFITEFGIFRGVGTFPPNAIIGGTTLADHAHFTLGGDEFVSYEPGAIIDPAFGGGPAPCSIADLDLDNDIDVFDLITFLQNFNPNDPNCPGAP